MPTLRAVVNEQVVIAWFLRDNTGAAATGLSGSISTNLDRESGTTMTDAAETVTVAEVGNGSYSLAFVPVNAGNYTLEAYESTLFAQFVWNVDVYAAGSALSATASDAFCAISDVEAYAQTGAYSSSTTPTDTQVLGFMKTRADELVGVLSQWMGSETVGPSNYSTTIDTGSDVGIALDGVLRMANAIGAAASAVEASGAGELPSRSERVAELFAMYEGMKGAVPGVESPLMPAAIAYIGQADTVATHFSEGEIARTSVTSRDRAAFEIDETTVW